MSTETKIRKGMTVTFLENGRDGEEKRGTVTGMPRGGRSAQIVTDDGITTNMPVLFLTVVTD